MDPNDIQFGDYIHGTLPEELLNRIKATTDVFESVDGVTFEKAVDFCMPKEKKAAKKTFRFFH